MAWSSILIHSMLNKCVYLGTVDPSSHNIGTIALVGYVKRYIFNGSECIFYLKCTKTPANLIKSVRVRIIRGGGGYAGFGYAKVYIRIMLI